MSAAEEERGAARKADSPQLRWGLRISPHVLVLLLMMLAAIAPLRGLIVSGVNLWWSGSYAQVDFVMDEARPNDGVPIIEGHLEGSPERRLIAGELQGASIVVKGLPQEAFVPGKRLPIWHSPDAPNFVVFGADVNDVPVALLPERPGVLSFAGHLAWLLLTLFIGIGLMAWVAHRWSGSYGALPIRSARDIHRY